MEQSELQVRIEHNKLLRRHAQLLARYVQVVKQRDHAWRRAGAEPPAHEVPSWLWHNEEVGHIEPPDIDDVFVVESVNEFALDSGASGLEIILRRVDSSEPDWR